MIVTKKLPTERQARTVTKFAFFPFWLGSVQDDDLFFVWLKPYSVNQTYTSRNYKGWINQSGTCKIKGIDQPLQIESFWGGLKLSFS